MINLPSLSLSYILTLSKTRGDRSLVIRNFNTRTRFTAELHDARLGRLNDILTLIVKLSFLEFQRLWGDHKAI